MNGLKRNGSGYVDPTAYKALINVQKGNKMEIYRGDIFFVGGSGGNRIGSEQKQDRPAIVVSNDKGNEHSPVVEVVFLTSAEKAKYLPTHVDVKCQIRSVALCEQVHSISKERLGDYIRSCTDAEMKAIDRALMISLGLEGTEKPSGSEKIIEDFKKETEEWEKLVEELKKQLEKTMVAKESDEMLIEKLKAENEELKDRNQRAKDNLQAVIDENNEQVKQIEQLSAENEGLKDNVSFIKGEFEKAAKLNEILEKSNQELEGKLASIPSHTEKEIRLETERNLYKKMYDELFEKYIDSQC